MTGGSIRLKADPTSGRAKKVRLKPDTTYENETTHEDETRADKTGVVSGFPGLSEREGSRTVIDQLQALEDARHDGMLALPDGDASTVTNLHKVFWPKQKLTKGDLFRYYVEVAPFILPAVADRPLVMKRFPNGIAAQPFYQHRAEDVPHRRARRDS